MKTNARGIYYQTGVNRGDYVIHQHRNAFWVDRIDTSGGTHTKVSGARGEPTLQAAIRRAREQAHLRGQRGHFDIYAQVGDELRWIDDSDTGMTESAMLALQDEMLPNRRPGAQPPAPPRRPARVPMSAGPASVLSSVRRMTREHEEREKPFDPERRYPRETKPHHFAVNPRRSPSQQYADMLIDDLLSDQQKLADLYVKPPSPADSLRGHLHHMALEGMTWRRSDVEDPSDRVAYVGQQAIRLRSVDDAISKRLSTVKRKAKVAAKKLWPEYFDRSGELIPNR